MKKRSFLLLPLILFGMVLAGCHGSKKGDTPSGDDSGQTEPGGEGDGGGTTDTVAVSSVSLAPTSLTLTVGGASGSLNATIMPVNATNKTVTWSIAPEGIATVTGNGLAATVAPSAAGDAVVTVKTADGNKTAVCNVKVNPAQGGEGGGGEGGGETVTEMTLTLTGLPTEAQAEHYSVYAWGGNAGQGQRYEATLETSTLTVTVPNDITGFLVATYNGTFDWDSLVFKSTDVTVVANQTTYAIPVPTTETIELTITDYPADKTADHYVVHAWGGASDASDSVATLEGTTLTAEVLADRTGFLVAAYNGDSFPENWDDLVYKSDDITIVADQTTYSLGGEGGQDPDAIPAHTLRVFTTEENYAMTLNGESEYHVQVELALNDSFKIKMSEDDTDWRGYDDFKTVGEGSAHANFEADGDNVKCTVAGTYDFYVAVSKNADENNPGKSVWVAVSIPPADRTGWKAVLNDADQAIVNSTDNLSQIELKDVEMEIGDKIIFQNADGSKKQGFAELKDDVNNGSANFEAGTGNELQCTVAGVFDFYVDLSLEKGVWVEKHAEPVVTMTITVSNYPDGHTAEHYIVHAWGGDAGSGESYNATLAAGVITATVPEDITGFLVAAYDGETIDWDSLVYKSDDITIVADQTEYALPVSAHTFRVFTTETNYQMTPNVGATEYHVQVTLALNDVFKIKMSEDDSDWRDYSDFKTVGAYNAKNNFEADGQNIKCLVAGTYDFYVATDGTSESIWVELVVDTVEFTITNFPASKTAEHYVVHAWTTEAESGRNYEATLNGTTLTANIPVDKIAFLVASFNGEFNWGTLVYQSPNIDIVSEQTNYVLPDLSEVEITITGLNANYANTTDYDVYAFAWGGDATDSFIPVEIDGTTATFTVANNANGCLLVRFEHGVAPAWGDKEDQTDDILFVKTAGVISTLSYGFPAVQS